MKTSIRKEAAQRRNAIPVPVRREKEKQILEYIKQLPLGDHVFLYKNMRSEVSTREILHWLIEQGATTYIPRTDLSDYSMEPHAYVPGDPLETKTFGLSEPINEPLHDLDQLTSILVPLLAFDRDFHRVGYGGGFYDRFLPRAPKALRVGIAFSEQEFDRLLQVDTDVVLDYIVTDKGVLTKKQDPRD